MNSRHILTDSISADRWTLIDTVCMALPTLSLNEIQLLIMQAELELEYRYGDLNDSE